MPKINHISFDLDGTLIDSLPLMREVGHTLQRKLALIRHGYNFGRT